ncbi:ABC transporter substrate-binding protein [uncultured Bifidobacterium sp.]|uniref:ABC transporter substrate-binding protein n=1 Tax=uncultured Bifidobacterium sp. TaxID=165187 RepID=UPI0025891A5D|nr:ABC transporter substrate-binding protein [uncultured Bifidobacterium sp.]
MNTKRWRKAAALAVAGLMTLSMGACGGDGGGSPQSDQVIINSVMNSSSQASLNYNPFSPTALSGVVGALYEPLFFMNNLKDDPTQLEPLMGESYTISDDAKTIDVKIREGKKWSDGEPYTAEDVAYTFNLVDSNASLNTSGFAGTAEVLSDTEVRITLDKSESVNALSYLSGTMIVPKHIWENIDDPVTYTNEDAVGSGPFTVEGGNFSPTAYTFMKNPYYWEDGKPEVDGVRYVLITGGTQASQNALTGGDVDWMSAIFPNMDQVLSGYPDIATVDVPSSQMAFMTCSNADLGCTGPITDPAVRKAIYYALDRDQINKLALNDQYSELAGSLYPYGQFTKYMSEDVPDSPIPGEARVDEATKILEDAGYTKGDDGIYQKDGVKLSIAVAVQSDYSDWINTINVAAQQLKEAGIEIHADQMSSNEWTQAMQQGEFEMSVYGLWVAGAEPWMFYNQFYATNSTAPVGESAWPNYARYSNQTVDDALNVINGTTDVNVKTEEYEKIQNQVFQDMPYIPILRQSGLTEMWTDKVTGWPTNDNVYANPQTWANPDLGIVLKNLKVKQ